MRTPVSLSGPLDSLTSFLVIDNSGHSEKMDQLQLPEGFRPDYKPKYVLTY